MWVFTSKTLTVYTIDERRSHEVAVEILGREFLGVLVADCFLAYDHQALADWLQQKCFAHFLRELSRLAREKRRGAVRFPRALAASEAARARSHGLSGFGPDVSRGAPKAPFPAGLRPHLTAPNSCGYMDAKHIH